MVPVLVLRRTRLPALAALVACALAARPRAAAADDPPAPAATAPKVAAAAPAPRADDMARAAAKICVDKEIADRLAVKRRRRGYDPRDFVKQARHELSAIGGYYVSDLFSSTYVAGGSYTYHMTEEAAVEFGAAVTHADADLVRSIEDGRGRVLDDVFAQVVFAESLLLWSPVHGKLRLGGSIVHFDIHLDAGVGVIDAPTSRGAAGVGGVGLKIFAGNALAVRIDVRDRVFRQELLEEHFLVNDVALTLGLSLFLPLRN